MKKRTSESEIAQACARLIRRTPRRTLTMRELRANLPNVVTFTEADCDGSASRPREPRWQAVLRNLRNNVGSAQKHGLAVTPDGFALCTREAIACEPRAFVERPDYTGRGAAP